MNIIKIMPCLDMLDIAATVENRMTRLGWVKNVSSAIHIPLTVGGGMSSMEDIEQVFKAGADKISINTSAVRNPDIVSQAAEKFDSKTVIVAIDVRKNKEMTSGFEVVVFGGTKAVTLPVIASGGAGTLEHFYEGAVQGGAQILLAASVFHYRTLSIKQVKEYLRDKGLQVNLTV